MQCIGQAPHTKRDKIQMLQFHKNSFLHYRLRLGIDYLSSRAKSRDLDSSTTVGMTGEGINTRAMLACLSKNPSFIPYLYCRAYRQC